MILHLSWKRLRLRSRLVLVRPSVPPSNPPLSMSGGKGAWEDKPPEDKPPAEAGPVFAAPAHAGSFFANRDAVDITPSGLYTATSLLCLSPGVPLQYKIFYYVICLCLLGLQVMSVIGLVYSADDLTTPEIAMDVSRTMTDKDWATHILLCILTASIIYIEVADARVTEFMNAAPLDAQHGESAALSRRWWLPLALLQKVRVEILVPLVAASAPLLAVVNNMDSFNAALNVMATLFLLECDDMVYSLCFSMRQRAFFEAEGFRLAPHRQLEIDLLSLTVPIATAFVGLMPIVWISGARDDMSCLEWAMDSFAASIHNKYRLVTWLCWFAIFFWAIHSYCYFVGRIVRAARLGDVFQIKLGVADLILSAALHGLGLCLLYAMLDVNSFHPNVEGSTETDTSTTTQE